MNTRGIRICVQQRGYGLPVRSICLPSCLSPPSPLPRLVPRGIGMAAVALSRALSSFFRPFCLPGAASRCSVRVPLC